MGFFSNLFSMGADKENIKEMLKAGAVVIDVRTRQEFMGGNVQGSKNYPLQEIQAKISELKKMKKPLVLCCASGNRSGQAASILKANGVPCENGGSWMQVNGLV